LPFRRIQVNAIGGVYKWSPLEAAAHNGHLQAVVCLIQNSANVNQQGGNMTPLTRAIKAKKQAVVKLLLRAGASPTLADKGQRTAMKMARSRAWLLLLLAELTSSSSSSASSSSSSSAAAVQGASTEAVEITSFRELKSQQNDLDCDCCGAMIEKGSEFMNYVDAQGRAVNWEMCKPCHKAWSQSHGFQALCSWGHALSCFCCKQTTQPKHFVFHVAPNSSPLCGKCFIKWASADGKGIGDRGEYRHLAEVPNGSYCDWCFCLMPARPQGRISGYSHPRTNALFCEVCWKLPLGSVEGIEIGWRAEQLGWKHNNWNQALRLAMSHLEREPKSPLCMGVLAQCLYQGHGGVTEDEPKSIIVANECKAVSTIAQTVLAMATLLGVGDAKGDVQKGVEMLKQTMVDRHPFAVYRMGALAEHVENWAEAKTLYLTSARGDCSLACYDLAEILIEGKAGVDKNPADAVEWYVRGAQLGHWRCKAKLGVILWREELIQGKEAEGIAMLKDAADNGEDIYAMHALTQILTKSSLEAAMPYHRMLAERGGAVSQYQLGRCYEKGEGGLAVSRESAEEWYGKAAAQGNADAKVALERLKGVQPAGYTPAAVEAVREGGDSGAAAASSTASADSFSSQQDRERVEEVLRSVGVPSDISTQLISDGLALDTVTELTQQDLIAAGVPKLRARKILSDIQERAKSGGLAPQAAAASSDSGPNRARTPGASLSEKYTTFDVEALDRMQMIINPAELDYNALSPHAQGGMGAIFFGEWAGSKVAIKEVFDSSSAIADFEAEVLAMCQLRSPNIVQLYGISLSPKRLMVMEMMSCSLFDIVHSRPGKGAELPFEWKQRISYACDIAQGVAYLHSRNILHRDIKAMNVLVSSETQVAKLADFGLSRRKTLQSAVHTQRQAVGSLPWMSPILFGANPEVTRATDVYAMAITFYEIAERRIPFDGSNPHTLPSMILQGARPCVDFSADVPYKFGVLVKAAWAEKPSQRPSARDLVTALKQVAQELDQPVVAASSPPMGIPTFLQQTDSSESLVPPPSAIAPAPPAAAAPAPAAAPAAAAASMLTTRLGDNPGVVEGVWTVSKWLASIGLEEYIAAFEAEGFEDPLDVKDLSQDDLKELGIAKMAHRRRFASFASQL
jgi:serine/threonine protein kinase/TPR repeat protein